MARRDKDLWANIHADFLVSGQTYPQLAEKYNVSLSAVKRYAAKEGWMNERAEIDLAARNTEPQNRTEPGESEPDGSGEIEVLPTASEIVEEKRERVKKFMEASDAMMDRILDALTSPEVISPYSMKLLASALRDLREMQGLNKSALDIEEQQARIEKLRSETRIVESPEANGIVVEFVDTFGAEE